MTKVWGSWKPDAFEKYSIWSKVTLVIVIITPKLGMQQIHKGSQPYPNCNWETMNNFCFLIDCKEPNPITKLCVSTWLMTPAQWDTSKSLKIKSWETVLTSSACDVRSPGLRDLLHTWRETRLDSLAHCFLGNIGVNTKGYWTYLSPYISWRNPSTDPSDFLLLVSKPEKLLEPSVYKMLKTSHGLYSRLPLTSLLEMKSPQRES